MLLDAHVSARAVLESLPQVSHEVLSSLRACEQRRLPAEDARCETLGRPLLKLLQVNKLRMSIQHTAVHEDLKPAASITLERCTAVTLIHFHFFLIHVTQLLNVFLYEVVFSHVGKGVLISRVKQETQILHLHHWTVAPVIERASEEWRLDIVGLDSFLSVLRLGPLQRTLRSLFWLDGFAALPVKRTLHNSLHVRLLH